MTGPQFDVSLLVWMISGYDFRIHAFYDADPKSGFLQALCTHSVPPERLVAPAGTTLTPKRCMRCQLLLGDILAGLLGDGTEWGK
jgi:hypothetical protein